MEESRTATTTTEDKDSQNEEHSRKSSSSMFCVKWNGFANQVREGLASLFGTEELVDVTLASSDGQRIRAHKIILAMSSPFFRRILEDNPCKHPIVIISGMKFRHVEHVIRFIYMGEVRMREDEIEDFIDAAESLKIDGITSTVNHFGADILSEPEIPTSTSPRAGVIRRNETATRSPVSPSKPTKSSPSRDSLSYLNVPDLKVTGYDEISPAVSPAGGRHYPNLNFSAPAWSPPFCSGLVGSPWSSSILQTRGHSHTHGRHSTATVLDMLEIRTDSSSSDGSPGVIVELKDEVSGAINLSDSREPPVPNRSLSEGDANSTNSAESIGRRRVNSGEKGYELSMPELSTKSKESSPRNSSGFTESAILPLHSPRSRQHGFSPQRMWQSEFGFPPPHTPHYLPLSLVAASAILSNHPPTRFLPVPQTSISKSMTSSSGSMMPRFGSSAISIATTTAAKNLSTSLEQVYRQQQSSDPRLHHHHHHHSSSSSFGSNPTSKGPPSSLTTLRAKLTASMFAHGNSPHYHKPNSRSSGLNILSSKPRSRSTTIRSSQVPPTIRYTANEVDAMVERVDNFPGPLVPCTVCQKFVKRERLRAHIHECHLLKGETIVCPQCGIGLKSKGSFRVHIWRHKRGSLGVKKLRDHNLPS